MSSSESASPRIAIYPTSANPPTWGHADILCRAAAQFDQVFWAAAVNPRKQYYFSVKERVAMMKKYVEHYRLSNVHVASFTGSTARYAESQKATVVLKGIRNTLDYQGELEQFAGNRGITPQLETFCMFAQPQFATISSSLVRELLFLEESIEEYVLPEVASMIKNIRQQRPEPIH